MYIIHNSIRACVHTYVCMSVFIVHGTFLNTQILTAEQEDQEFKVILSYTANPRPGREKCEITTNTKEIPGDHYVPSFIRASQQLCEVQIMNLTLYTNDLLKVKKAGKG